MAFEFIQIADDLLSFKIAASIERTNLAAKLRTLSGIDECVEGMETITLQFDPLSTDITALKSKIADLETQITNQSAPLQDVITIPIIYNETTGPDLKHVCEALGLSVDDFIQQHTSQIYKVDLIGFTPGFAYIGGAAFDIPRLKEPRVKVEAGSVGLTSGYTGIYALEGPGGWPIIGRTTKKLFDPDQQDPFILSPHMRVKFEAVSP
ncbi:5-oxoprolinase subunit B family protein [Hirschia baltica]|uniref:Allophanate hydrolase subunit 1 n=1 Tax=Hirschia baltica (strain ATCC 49814 / DSM 5838 / IFAM 1418) TaxID=582402 RepID=C6XL45_HIRBI|nr:allophanate hydrolase subunit 1 [Hirschia baltica]ACT57874.1 Allophanate hydrolase subunit 1 [Hirschia baltica ATCC 49814]